MLVKPLADCSEEHYQRIFNANTKRVFFTLQKAARVLHWRHQNVLSRPVAVPRQQGCRRTVRPLVGVRAW
jgi:NAD(P)-dependent dehydrogenase (short-subunit alcohol dehydrogenase family)